MEVFDSYPHLEDERLIIRKMDENDAEALGALARSREVYRFEPTFLFEHKYDDPKEVIARMDAECFRTKNSILCGVYLKEAPGTMTGIAEIYALEESKPKVSIGYRFREAYWGRGIATETCALLKAYLINDAGVRTITAHVMPENPASAHVLIKNNFLKLFTNCPEDWGFPEPLMIDKYVFKRRWLTMSPEEIAEEVKGYPRPGSKGERS